MTFIEREPSQSNSNTSRFRKKEQKMLQKLLVTEYLEQLSSTAPTAIEKQFFVSEMQAFQKLLDSLHAKKSALGPLWENIHSPDPSSIVHYQGICDSESIFPPQTLLSKFVVLKLNGGLGTTMGCEGPKSLIDVKNGQCFLDLVVEQVAALNTHYDCSVPLVLMNSFNTHQETLSFLEQGDSLKVDIRTFEQSRFPRIYKDSLLPVPKSLADEKEAWYPPGHGNLFHSLNVSGLLGRLLDEGREYMFISNIDNLGATVDLNILAYMANKNIDFIMEITDKTLSDVKGGTLVEYDGNIKLLEIAQVSPENIEEFKSIKKFKFFNTNNIWVNLKALKNILYSGSLDSLDLIVNQKQLGRRPILQLETAVGAAIQFFKNARGLNVSRSRFLPVKTTNDLLILQSPLYTFEMGKPVRTNSSILENAPPPLISLGSHFKNVEDYNAHFKGIPDIRELTHLTVSGNVFFGTNVTLKGTVIIITDDDKEIHIPSGTVLENKVVSGSLRIVDH